MEDIIDDCKLLPSSLVEKSMLANEEKIFDDSYLIELIYSYWFGEAIDIWSKYYPLNINLWHKNQEILDKEIKDKFEKYLIEATNSNSNLYQCCQATHRGKLALIILFDQFSRKIYRNTPKMFEFDSLALLLSLEIVDDPTHVSSYSFPERIFVYYPLVHSENIVHTTRGVDLLHKLSTEIHDNYLSKKYEAIVRKAKECQRLMEKFGRYPDRNELLGRQSNPEEIAYLKNISDTYQNLKRPIKSLKPTNELSANDSNRTQTSRSRVNPRLKILVLHGCRQNGNTMRFNAKKIVEELKDVAYFYFSSAPLPYKESEDVIKQFYLPSDETDLLDNAHERQWWTSPNDSTIYHHLDLSLYYIEQIFKTEGPFDGIFGFAEGAVLASILSGLQPIGNILFNFAVLISGFPSTAKCHRNFMQPNAIKKISSLHIYGVNDRQISASETLRLASFFANSKVVSHLGGHFTPNYWPYADIKQFLNEYHDNRTQTFEMTINLSHNELQTLKTFDEKLKATISFHQKRKNFSSRFSQQKRKRISVTPIGLGNSIKGEDFDSVINNLGNYEFDDVMLLVWCKRMVFYSSELIDENNQYLMASFFYYWIKLYLKESSFVLSEHLHKIPKYGSWTDLVNIYFCADRMINVTDTEIVLLKNLKAACIKLIGEQLKADYDIVLQQSSEYADNEDEKMLFDTPDWISCCANEVPEISNDSTKLTTIMAKEIAEYLQRVRMIACLNKEVQSNTWKACSYQNYRHVLLILRQILGRVSPNFINQRIKSINRKDRGLFCTRSQRDQLLAAAVASTIMHPEPQPVIPRTLDEFQPLLEHLSLNKPAPQDENDPIVFPRGTIMSDGRLDLCKQVVGPQGVKTLLDAMQHNFSIHRLLLGNNIVGYPGAKAISEYIRHNSNSTIDTWYIACNRFDSDSIALICDALTTDNKVKAVWLKRNPILTTGARHIAQMLSKNTCLQILDLLNTGLFDQGCEILFNGLKHNHSLKHLYIDANGLTVKSGQIIRLHFEENQNHLETLSIGCNSLSDEGTSQIAEGLKQDKTLRRLSLQSNSIGPDGIRTLVDSLINHQTLQLLNLGFMKSTNLYDRLNNVIGDKGAIEIARLLTFNHHIRSIDLAWNGISQRGLAQLRDALRRNKTLTTLSGLQFGKMDNDNIKDEMKSIIKANRIEWGRQVLCAETDCTTNLTEYDYLKKGEQLNYEINFPEHVMDVNSYYRTN